MESNLINIGLIVAYVALFIAVAALVIFPIISMIGGNIKSAKGTLLGIAALVAVVVIAYILSPADQGDFYTKTNTSAQASKLIGTGLVTTYIIMIGLVVITVYTSVVKWFK